MKYMNSLLVDACGCLHGKIAGKLAEVRGQGTTEYAILVGVPTITFPHNLRISR